MGGRIAVGVIEKDGTLRTIEGHTNPLPRIMKTEAFANGDFSGMQKYMDDYGNDVFNEGFGPHANTPKDYGYILFDRLENKIMSSQGYTNLFSLLAAEVRMTGERDPAKADGMARLITHRRDWSDEVQGMVAVEIEPFRDLAHMTATPGAMVLPDDHWMSRQYEIRYPAWTVVDMDRNEQGFEKIRDYLDVRGLLSADEWDGWDLAIQEIRREKAEMAALDADGSATPATGV